MILDKIVADKKMRLVEHKEKISEMEMKRMALSSKRESISFRKALKREGLSIIGEFKKASPSLGEIKNQIDLMDRIEQYNESVDAISCLTEEDHFRGNVEYFKKIRSISELPLLRKDFIIEEYQVYEAKVIGADAILLIAAILSDERMKWLYDLAYELGMDVLLEVHDEWEMERALKLDAKIIGVNNRNLKDFSIDLETTKYLSHFMPKEKLLVSESGVTDAKHISFLEECGVDALLIGRAFMESESPKRLAKEWKKIYENTKSDREKGARRVKKESPMVKICGITSKEEIAMLNREKPEYAGFVLFYPKSKRNHTIESISTLLEELDPAIKKVAVTVSPDKEQMKAIEKLGFDVMQIHGKLKKEVLDHTKLPIFRAYNIGKEEFFVERHEKIVGYVLDGKIAGRGEVFSWEKMKGFKREGKLLILAGGLNSENVAEGISIMHPDIVDVSSGVENQEGTKKDPEKVHDFIQHVRSATDYK